MPRACSVTSCLLAIICVRGIFCVKPLGCNHFLMSTITRVAEPVGADFERREPRRRICRDAGVRIVVNELLDWRGVLIILGRSKIHRITLTEILRDLAPLNEGRDKKD
jgi:hypothetical protein